MLHLVCRILQLLNVLDMDAVTVPQGFGGGVFEELCGFLLGDEVLQGLLFGHKGHRGHIGDRFDLILQGSGLVLAEGFVHIGQELVFILQILKDVPSVNCNEGEGPHDQQAGHGHTHRRKGHEPMGKDTPDALFDIIPNLSITHCRNTLLLRH